MSIITDNRGSSYRIARFGNIATVNNVTYKAKQYARISNGYFAMKHSGNTSETSWRYQYGSSSNDSVLIKCEIPSTVTNAYFYGFYTNENAQMWIGKVDTKIKWAMGVQVREVDYQPGVHVYGFDSAGYAVYDGTRIGNIMRQESYSASRNDIVIGARRNGDTFDYATIDIYEVVLLAYRKSTMASRDEAHLYAASGDDTTPVLFETRKDSTIYGVKSFTEGSGGSGSVGGDVTYGIQLHDLKFVTGSGYRDLVALICEDWTAQAASDADPAYTLKNGNDTFVSAFMLKGINPNTGGVSTNMPVPSGWKHEGESGGVTPPTRSKTRATILGELIYGRKPKWNLWSDNINIGKKVIIEGNAHYYVYNIFLPLNGLQKPNLEQFLGYSNAESAIAKPGFNVQDGSYNIEYHNGVPCICGINQRVPLGNTGITLRDDAMVFLYEKDAITGDVTAKLGNLVNWHLTPNEQNAADADNIVTGMSCAIQHIVYLSGEPVYYNVAQAYRQTTQSKSSEETFLPSGSLMPLSSKSDDATKKLFKLGKEADGTTDANIGMSLTGTNETRLYHDISVSDSNTITARAMLSAINSVMALDNPPIGSQLITTDLVIPTTDVQIHGNLDTKVFSNSSTNYRCILMDEGAVKVGNNTYYVYPVMTNQTNGAKTAWGVNDSIAASNRGFCLVFALLTTEWTAASQPVDATNIGTMYMILETLSNNNGTYTKGRYAAQLGLYQTSDSNPATGSLTAISDTLLPNGNRLLTMYQEQADAQKYIIRHWFPKSEIGAVFNGDTFMPGTTVKAWVKHTNDPSVLYKFVADYYSMNDSWRLQYMSSPAVYLFFENQDLELASRTAQMRFSFASWQYSSSTGYTPRAINTTTDAKKVKVTVYQGWDTATTVICTATFTGGPHYFTKESGTSGWDITLIGSGHIVNDPNDGLSPTDPTKAYSGGIYGYDVTITPTGSTQWNNLLVRVVVEAV